MPGLLGRSKSFRMLRRGFHDDPHPRETDKTTPQFSRSQVDVARLKGASFPTSVAAVETPEMLQRPQTAGGIGGDHSIPPPFHKKARPFQQQANNSFDFAPLSPNKSNTVLYAAEVYESTEGIIGIALGSPTMASHWNGASPGSDFGTHPQGTTVTHITSNPPAANWQPQAGAARTQQDASKPKMSRWKSLFRKTGPPPRLQEREPFYQLEKTIPSARADSHHDEEPQEDDQLVQSPASYSYNPSIRESRKVPKGQPQPTVDTRPRALTLTNAPPPKPKTSLLRSASNAISPRFPKKSPLPPPQVVVSNSSKETSLKPPSSQPPPMDKPVLNVAIPEVRLDRYSVMFSSLLQENQFSSSASTNPTSVASASPVQRNQDSTSTSATSSSLLQRRQAEQLKPLDRLSIKHPSENGSLKPQRRVTSPGHAKSPSAGLSLFPSPNTSRAPSPRSLHTSMHRPRPVQRARTEPAATNPPHHQGDEQDPGIGLAITPETPQDLTTPLTSTTFAPSTASRNSFESDGGEEITVRNLGGAKAPTVFRPTLPLDKEPEWEIVLTRSESKVTKNDALRSHPSVHQPSSAPLEVIATASPVTLIRSSSSARSHRVSVVTSTSPSSTKSPTGQQATKTATATVGVARSVSVSRANSPLLKPGSATSTSTTSIDGRLGGDIRALTPTLVELKNRRSQRVQLVDA